MSAQGCVNAAPFSFFNMMGDNPPVVAVGFSNRLLRNTAQNIVETGAFVINLVAEETAQVMNQTSLPVPADINEMEMFGLQARASTHPNCSRDILLQCFVWLAGALPPMSRRLRLRKRRCRWNAHCLKL